MTLDINVLGRAYTATWDCLEEDNMGHSDNLTAVIQVRPGLDDYLNRDTLLHEVMHCILRQQGRDYCKAEEVYVSALATGLIAVLDANPDLRKYLTS